MISTSEFSGQVICMGGISMDLVMFMERLPLPGETLFTDNFAEIPGGKGGNQAHTAARMRADTRFFGKVGHDSYGDRLVRSMLDAGVNVDNVGRDDHAGSGITMVFVEASGQNAICFAPGANKRLTPYEVQANAKLFGPGDILLITMELDGATVYAAIETAKAAGAFVILDPAPARKDIPAHIPGLVDIVKPNEMEAGIITGVQVADVGTASLAAERLAAIGFKLPIVTLGGKGSIAWLDGTARHIKPLPVSSIDTTAAGDVFNGSLAAALSRNEGIEYALEFASVASALSTTVRGAQPSIPDYDTVVEAMSAEVRP